MTEDAENRTVAAMAAQSLAAEIAVATGQVDLADDTAAQELRIVAGNDARRKFVAGRALKVVITALKFQVGIADSSDYQFEKGEAGRPFGSGLADSEFASIEKNTK